VPQWHEAEAALRSVAQPTLPDLVTTSDPDWAKYLSDDPAWFLRVAGKAIRTYCGWHIYPNQRDCLHHIRTGAKGIIMLPSRYVTAVESLSINVGDDSPPQCIKPHDYEWFQSGWIQRKGWSYYNDWQFSGYYYGNDPFYLPVSRPGEASCTFWHGYTDLPDDVKQVAFELGEQAMAARSGNVKMLEAPIGFRVQVSQNFGLILNQEQMARLANYRTGRFI
jgi:hypothetical protein